MNLNPFKNIIKDNQEILQSIITKSFQQLLNDNKIEIVIKRKDIK